MNSSVKFLLPTITVGFAFGFAEATAAVPPKTIATPNEIAKAAFAARRVCLRIMFPPPPAINVYRERAYGTGVGLGEAARRTRERIIAARKASAETQSEAATTPPRP